MPLLNRSKSIPVIDVEFFLAFLVSMLFTLDFRVTSNSLLSLALPASMIHLW